MWTRDEKKLLLHGALGSKFFLKKKKEKKN